MSRHAVFAVVAWLCLVSFCVAASLTFPALTGRVVDQAGLLSVDDRATLIESLSALQVKTTDQLVVVTLNSLQGTTIEEYGYQLGRQWQIGQKDRDSGVLLIVAAAERKVRIEVGYGLEGTLTDAATRLIIENSILPPFKAGDLASGIKAGAAEIIRALGGNVGSLQSQRARGSGARRSEQDTPIPVWLLIVVGLGGVGLLILCMVTRGGGFCQGILQMIFLLALSGRGGSSRQKSSFSGGGGSFGGGGSSGSW